MWSRSPSLNRNSSRDLHVSVSEQRLYLREGGRILATYPVSTSARGLGELRGSLKTPRGWHYIRAKIGAGLPENAVLVGRRWTGELWSPSLQEAFPDRDWILGRILWLCGLEPGFNRGGEVDTFRRYIYLHGSPPFLIDGRPRSHGCLRMRPQDIVQLFEQVEVGTRVLIAP